MIIFRTAAAAAAAVAQVGDSPHNKKGERGRNCMMCLWAKPRQEGWSERRELRKEVLKKEEVKFRGRRY